MTFNIFFVHGNNSFQKKKLSPSYSNSWITLIAL